MPKGELYWITGLSGAGKTTIARELYTIMKDTKSNVVYLDGDIMREVFNAIKDYSQQERLKLAMQYSRLCKLLTDQNIDVICATISMFPQCWEWNRQHIPKYREIYIRVPMDILIQRDQKRLYSQALKGKTKHVMGIDIPFTEPEEPHLTLENEGNESPELLAKQILQYFN